MNKPTGVRLPETKVERGHENAQPISARGGKSTDQPDAARFPRTALLLAIILTAAAIIGQAAIVALVIDAGMGEVLDRETGGLPWMPASALVVALLLVAIWAYLYRALARWHAEKERGLTAAEESNAHRALIQRALDSIEDGFILYDGDDRIVIFNRRFSEIFKDQAQLYAVGRSYTEILETGLRFGLFAEAVGREQEWLRARL